MTDHRTQLIVKYQYSCMFPTARKKRVATTLLFIKRCVGWLFIIFLSAYKINKKGKVKGFPLQARCGPEGG